MAKPFIKWVGGKTQLLPELLHRIPDNFNCYYEPFLGGGALVYALSEKNLIKSGSILSDTNYELVNAFNVVKDNLDELIRILSTCSNDEDEFYVTREADRFEEFKSISKARRAARFIYLLKTCYNGLYRVNQKGQFNTPFGKYKNPNICDVETLTECSNLLQGVSIQWREFLTTEFCVSEKDFVYFDPPYYPVKTGSFTGYQREKFNKNSHRELYQLFRRLTDKGVYCMVSNSDTEFTRDLYKDYSIDTVTARRNVNSKGNARGPVNELIIRNY